MQCQLTLCYLFILCINMEIHEKRSLQDQVNELRELLSMLINDKIKTPEAIPKFLTNSDVPSQKSKSPSQKSLLSIDKVFRAVN